MTTPAKIHESAFVGPGVELGDNVVVGPGAVILGPCIIEDSVYIAAGAQIGAPPEMSTLPQNAAWDGALDHAGVRICQGAVIRESVVIHQGTYRETTVGEGSWVLNRAYLAHDVLLGANSTVSARVSIGGHCVIGDCVNIGMNASVHQRRIVGFGAMVGMGTPLSYDVPPFAKAYGSPSRMHGVNSVGMDRAGLTSEQAAQLTEAYVQGDYLLERCANASGLVGQIVASWRSVGPGKIIPPAK